MALEKNTLIKKSYEGGCVKMRLIPWSWNQIFCGFSPGNPFFFPPKECSNHLEMYVQLMQLAFLTLKKCLGFPQPTGAV